MLKSIAGTLLSKVLVILITFFTVVVNTRVLGSEGIGEIALINLAILVGVTTSNFFGGGAIVFLTPRVKAGKLALPAYIWAIVVAFGMYWFVMATDFFRDEYAIHLAILGLLQSLFIFHFQVMVGKKRLPVFNRLIVVQAALVFASLLVFFFILEQQVVIAFIWSLYISFGVVWLSSIILIWRHLDGLNFISFRQTARQIARFGFYSELSNVLQILVRRSNYIFAEILLGTSFLGIYSVSLQLSETIKVIGNSMATVQYSEVANSTNALRNRLLTIRLFKAAVVLTTVAAFVLVLIPDSVYTFVFGEEFGFLNDLLWWLLPAMIAMAMRAILSHHFAGIGKPYINTITAVVGIFTVVPLGYFLTVDGLEVSNEMALVGLATATSVGFSIQALFQWVWFARMEKVGLRAFLIKPTDFTFVKNTIKRLLKKS